MASKTLKSPKIFVIDFSFFYLYNKNESYISLKVGTAMKTLSLKWNPDSRRFYFLCYTLVFLFLSAIIFLPFTYHEKSLIWRPDGLTQHFNSFVYFRNWALSALQNLAVNHQLSIPLWDSCIGYGSDILTTLHYYVIGDPLNLLALLVPVRYLEALFNFLVLLRLYLAGGAFSCYCFRMKRSRTAAIAGSLIYVFGGYGIALAPMHPYFINPMIYLPLLLIGVERIFHKEKGHLLIAMTALSAVSNFYFFYMLVILTVLYCIIRFCTMKHLNWKQELVSCLGRTLFFSLTGVCISAVLLLPVLLQFTSDMRSATGLTYAPLYEWSYYEQIFDQFISLYYLSNWTYLCFATPALLCVFLLFLKKKQFYALKIGFLILTGFLLLPAAGSFLNGLSYPTNRWDFGYAFLIALIVVYLWPDLFSLTSGEKKGLFLLFLLYGCSLCLMYVSGSSHAFFSLFLLLLTLLYLTGGINSRLSPKAPKWLAQPQICLLLLIFINISANSILFYRSNPDNHLNRFVNTGEGLSSLEQTTAGMASLFLEDPSDFSRYAQDMVPVRNDTLNQRANSIHYYWSLSNGAISQFFNELALPFEERSFKYDSLDNRAQLHALAGVRWYIRHDPNQYLPYPFADTTVYDYLDEIYYASRTETFLPFGYTCAPLISHDTYLSLPYLQRQQALLQSVVCEELPDSVQEAELTFYDQEIPFQISYGSDILEWEGKYYALTDQAELTLSFDGLPVCETYLLIEGLTAQDLTEKELYTKAPTAQLLEEEYNSLSVYEKNRQKRKQHYASDIAYFPITCTSEVLDTSFCYYASLTESSYERSDFLINMGYTPKEQHTITLTLPCQGIYSFRNLSVLCLPLEHLSEQVDALRQERLEQVTFQPNRITGHITLTERKLLCLSIPYSKGWTALADGKTIPLQRANTMYLALPLDAGDHSIELHYRTPGLTPSILISCSGLFIWLLYLILTRQNVNAGK